MNAILHADAELVPLPARLAVIAAGLFPGFVADAMAVTNRLLPRADGGAPEAQRGRESAAGVSRTIERLTERGRRAAGELLQHPLDSSS